MARRETLEEKARKEKTIKLGSLAGGALMLLVGLGLLAAGLQTLGVTAILLGAVTTVLPSTIFTYAAYAKYAAMENEFPRFLRDLAEGKKSGMTFPQALAARRESDYGALSEEIRRASNQLSWGVPFEKVIAYMGKRVSKSPVMKRTFLIILEAFKSGGDVTGVMEDLSGDLQTLKEIEAERKAAMSQQIVMMYFISVLFLGIIMMLYHLLIPMISIETMGEGGGMMAMGAGGGADYCSSAAFLCAVCPVFGFGEIVAEASELMTQNMCYFESLFFFMAMIQAVGSGIVAGEIGEGSAAAGIKHGLVLASIALVVFVVFG